MTKNNSILNKFLEVRDFTSSICEELEVEDYVIQAAEFVSPAKWHLAHTTWFFEEFILKTDLSYKEFHPKFSKIFNSYYNSIGEYWKQGERGVLSRPTVREIIQYRKMVDNKLLSFFKENESEEIFRLLEIGLNHEQQHQELLVMDLKYNLFCNPLKPTIKKNFRFNNEASLSELCHFEKVSEFSIGADYSNGFCFDNETPKHLENIQPFSISNQLVTNGEYLEFIESKAYEDHEYWYSDGFKLLKEKKQGIPLYWYQESGEWFEYNLDTISKLDINEPVKHISFYEASAFAAWKGCRLPTEKEWEYYVLKKDDSLNVKHELWQWTSSPYTAYPGYKKPKGALGEYNQKFMLNQIVLKGGCVATPKGHYRHTYRNFFYPDQKWMFSGIRLAKDLI